MVIRQGQDQLYSGGIAVQLAFDAVVSDHGGGYSRMTAGRQCFLLRADYAMTLRCAESQPQGHGAKVEDGAAGGVAGEEGGRELIAGLAGVAVRGRDAVDEAGFAQDAAVFAHEGVRHVEACGEGLHGEGFAAGGEGAEDGAACGVSDGEVNGIRRESGRGGRRSAERDWGNSGGGRRSGIGAHSGGSVARGGHGGNSGFSPRPRRSRGGAVFPHMAVLPAGRQAAAGGNSSEIGAAAPGSAAFCGSHGRFQPFGAIFRCPLSEFPGWYFGFPDSVSEKAGWYPGSENAVSAMAGWYLGSENAVSAMGSWYPGWENAVSEKAGWYLAPGNVVSAIPGWYLWPANRVFGLWRGWDGIADRGICSAWAP